MDPDSLLKVFVEIVKALPTKYGAFILYCLHDGVGAWSVAMARLIAQGVELTGKDMVYSYQGWDTVSISVQSPVFASRTR